MKRLIVYLKEFLELKNIVFIENENRVLNTCDLSENIVIEKLKVLGEFHSRTRCFDGYILNHLENYTGKIIEENKIEIKRVKKLLDKVENNYSNDFEKKLSEIGKNYLSRAEESIENIYKNNYLNILRRSMRRNEICIKNIDINDFSLDYSSNKIIINDNQVLVYNQIELDCYYLLKKVSKYSNVDCNKLVRVFCEIEELDKNSEIFILSLLSYPSGFMKCCSNYKLRKKDWSIEKYVMKLNRAIEKDTINLL